LSQSLEVELCAKCFHPENNHGVVCSGDLMCLCEKFVPPFFVRFAQRIEKEKYERKNLRERCDFILSEIPQTRNAGEKNFPKIYLEIWHGFKIRKFAKDSTPLTTDMFEKLPIHDSINREKRRCKQWNESLRTYSPKVLMEQTAIYQALMEMAIE